MSSRLKTVGAFLLVAMTVTVVSLFGLPDLEHVKATVEERH